MSFNYNQVTLVGRLTKDPDFYQITETFCKLNFTLAVSRHYRREDGSSDADFVPITVFGKSAIIGAQLLTKGNPVLVWGRLKIRSYEKDDQKHWITEIVADNFQLLERKPMTADEAADESMQEEDILVTQKTEAKKPKDK